MDVTRIRIAAVGDILMWRQQIESARRGQGRYSFDEMFQPIAGILNNANLVIGNLETTLSGREAVYQKRNPLNGYPMFNCPDELAGALKRAGFDVLTTANNHCLDRGVQGLKRTLNVLDRYGLAHTGTFRTREESQRMLIRTVQGIRFGIVAYTYGTNGLKTPASQTWSVNRIQEQKMVADVERLRPQVDVLIAAMHFGQEFMRYPNDRQRTLVNLLLNHGVDVVLGAHPHVLQPLAIRRVTDRKGVFKPRFVAYSLGNFVSVKMTKSVHSTSGVIVQITIEKSGDADAKVAAVQTVPTWVHQYSRNGRPHFRILPVRRFLQSKDPFLRESDRGTLHKVWRTTSSHLRLKSS